MESLQGFCEAIEGLYQEIEDQIDPHIKRVWIENQIATYEQWEGEAGKLPGRLTKEYVDEHLLELRAWRDKFQHTPDGVMEYQYTPRSSNN
ncbi:MAG TPA: hypothetical protein VMR81_00625 [Patescibacteria group bacterium]|nr:hypothetical protein [Patescibacteria group bacterium]